VNALRVVVQDEPVEEEKADADIVDSAAAAAAVAESGAAGDDFKGRRIAIVRDAGDEIHDDHGSDRDSPDSTDSDSDDDMLDDLSRSDTFKHVIQPLLDMHGFVRGTTEGNHFALSIARLLKAFDRHTRHNTSKSCFVEELQCWASSHKSVINPAVSQHLPRSYKRALSLVEAVLLPYEDILVCPCEEWFYYGSRSDAKRCGKCNADRSCEGSLIMKYWPIKNRIERFLEIVTSK
jgi:hypothetical protein